MMQRNIIGHEIRDWIQKCNDHALNDIIYQLPENGIVYINHSTIGKKQKNEVDIVSDIQILLGALRQDFNYHLHEVIVEALHGITWVQMGAIGHRTA